MLPPGFAMPGGQADILQPQRLSTDDGSILTAFGRLKRGVTPEQAKAAIAPLIDALPKENALGMPGEKAQPRVVPLRDYLAGEASRVAWLLIGAVTGLLLIACVNVANLILARIAARDREFAVRLALGAGRARLARLAITESVLLAVAGGGIGLVMATTMLRAFVRLAPSSMPEIDQASLDLRVFAVAVVLALAAGMAVGIWPALSVLRSAARQYGLRAVAPARPRMRFALVTIQIALTVTLLTGSALLLRTLAHLNAVPLGYDSESVLTMMVVPNVVHYPPDARGPFFERVLERIREIPGTAAVTMSSAEPPNGVALAGIGFSVDRQPDGPRPGRGRTGVVERPSSPFIRIREVTAGYFETLGIRIVRGRAFAEADRTAQPAVILSESAARILFPGQDPIGHTVRVRGSKEWADVVGVAGEIRNTGPTVEPQPELYALWRRDGPSLTSVTNTAFFAIRMQAGTTNAAAFLKQAVADLDPQLPVTIQFLDDEVARLTERPRFLASMLSSFAGLALVLAAAGLFGVASYLVTQRRRELAVRIALGAAPGPIARQVITEAGRWIAGGAAGGALLAWVVGRVLASQLFEVAATDPLAWIGAFTVLGVALLTAVALPAVRAARVDPIEALQADD